MGHGDDEVHDVLDHMAEMTTEEPGELAAHENYDVGLMFQKASSGVIASSSAHKRLPALQTDCHSANPGRTTDWKMFLGLWGGGA